MKSQILKSPLPYLALLIAHVIWGGNFVVAKITLQEIPTMILAFSRFALAALLILPFFFLLEKKEKKVKLEHLPKLFAVGLLLITFHITLFFEGLNRTTSLNASVLTLITPILSLLGGWWFLREKIYFANLFGVFISLIGAVLIIGIPIAMFGNFSSTHLLGDLLIILSAITLIAGLLLVKENLKSYSPITLTLIIFVIGAATFAVPAALDHLKNPKWIEGLSLLGILGFLYIVLLSSVSAFFLQIWGLKKIEVYKANLLHYVEPAVTATLAVPLLGEAISYPFIIGTCLIVLGVYWGTLGKQEHHHPHHKAHRT